MFCLYASSHFVRIGVTLLFYNVILLWRKIQGVVFLPPCAAPSANCQSSIDCINMQLNGNSVMQSYCGKPCVNGPFN